MNEKDRQVVNKADNRFFYPALLFSSLLLLIPALYNHYPLVNPDTETYIASGFKLEMPSSRPITYGLLIRLFSLNGMSLWLPVFVQAYMVSWLLFRVIKNLAGDGKYMVKSLVVVFLLSVCTGLSWVVSQVQPDVFTPVAFLCIAILLMNKEHKQTNVLLYVLFFISVAVHLSHPVLMVATLLLLLFVSRVYMVWPGRKIGVLLVLSCGSILVMTVPMAKSGHVFFMGTLLEKKVLKQYLDDKCAAKNYRLCAYKDALPADGDEFIWSEGSPLYKMGGWRETKPEFTAIIHDLVTTPRYLGAYLAATIRQTWQQGITFGIGAGNEPSGKGSAMDQRIMKDFPREISCFENDRENTTPLQSMLVIPNEVFAVVVLLCLPVLVYLAARWRRQKAELKLLFIVCIAGIILNCVDAAAFSRVNGRYGCKMIWLIPFCVLAAGATTKEREV